MKDVVINLSKENVESILINLMKLRQKVNSGEVFSSDELASKYAYSLSNTGYILENIKQQCLSQNDYTETSAVAMDIESYVNLCAITSDAINELNENIIRAIMVSNQSEADRYTQNKEELMSLYNKLISERFEHLYS